VSFNYRTLLLEAMKTYLEALSTDDPRSPLEAMPVGVVAPFAIVLLHVSMGTPLYLTDSLLELWVKSDGNPVECLRDGYRQPASITMCSVCGSATGEPGCWAKRRAIMAGCN
jgi:hypothetical protein